MPADPSYSPWVSLFNELGIKLNNQLFWPVAALKQRCTDFTHECNICFINSDYSIVFQMFFYKCPNFIEM